MATVAHTEKDEKINPILSVVYKTLAPAVSAKPQDLKEENTLHIYIECIYMFAL